MSVNQPNQTTTTELNTIFREKKHKQRIKSQWNCKYKYHKSYTFYVCMHKCVHNHPKKQIFQM